MILQFKFSLIAVDIRHSVFNINKEPNGKQIRKENAIHQILFIFITYIYVNSF